MLYCYKINYLCGYELACENHFCPVLDKHDCMDNAGLVPTTGRNFLARNSRGANHGFLSFEIWRRK